MKKCKFCGGNGIIKKDGVAYYGTCQNCFVRTYYAQTEEEAVEIWNKLMSDNKKKEGNNG